MKIYIACGLTHVPISDFNRYVKFLHRMAGALRDRAQAHVTYALLDSCALIGDACAEGRARLCYSRDRELIERVDLVVAEASYPSTGMGIELEIAAARSIPIVICFKKEAVPRADPKRYENPDLSEHELYIGEGFVSPMALGIPSLVRTIDYVTDRDGIAAVVEAVASLKLSTEGTRLD